MLTAPDALAVALVDMVNQPAAHIRHFQQKPESCPGPVSGDTSIQPAVDDADRKRRQAIAGSSDRRHRVAVVAKVIGAVINQSRNRISFLPEEPNSATLYLPQQLRIGEMQ